MYRKEKTQLRYIIMNEATIIKIISNRYEVLDNEGNRHVCVAMGKLRKQKSPVVGDRVYIEHFDSQIGIQKIMPRKNELVRPSIANVDQAIIVMSCKDPDFSTVLIDRLIFQVCYANIHPILCFTKMDMITEDDDIHQQIQAYRDSGYEVYVSGVGYDNHGLIQALKGKISVLTGQSGAGKSSLLNRIDPRFQLKTQEISKALGRGKHTTRHCELHEIAQGWVADTPGFSSLDFTSMNILDLANTIPDFKPYVHQCKFNDCKHLKESNCAIREATENHMISQERYQHYIEVVQMILQAKPKY